jgi:hypothetical protein
MPNPEYPADDPLDCSVVFAAKINIGGVMIAAVFMIVDAINTLFITAPIP